jgi:hypothetical protein
MVIDPFLYFETTLWQLGLYQNVMESHGLEYRCSAVTFSGAHSTSVNEDTISAAEAGAGLIRCGDERTAAIWAVLLGTGNARVLGVTCGSTVRFRISFATLQ